MKDKKLIVKRSSAGLGLYAGTEFKKGDTIVEYVGKKITNAEADRKGGKYLFDLNAKYTIDGTERTNIARYINHSCKPNATAYNVRGRVFIEAHKRIIPGEEITYNYGKQYFEHFIKPHGCRCAKCKPSTQRVASRE